MSDSYLTAVVARAQDSANRGDSSSAPRDSGLTLDGLLSELDIEKYRDSFAAAGIGDEQLLSARAGGEEAVDALIKAVGLRGGSATKVRRHLLANSGLKAQQETRDEARQGRPPARPRGKKSGAPPPVDPKFEQRDVQQHNGQFILRSQADLDVWTDDRTRDLLCRPRACWFALKVPPCFFLVQWVFQQARGCMDASGIVAVQFKATWCGGCKKFAPTYARLGEELRTTYLCNVDVDEAPELAQAHAVSQLPHFVLFRDGQKWDTLIGGKATILRQKVLYALEGRLYNASKTESKRVG